MGLNLANYCLVFLGFLIFSQQSYPATESSVPTLQGRPLKASDVDLQACKAVSDSDAGTFGRFLWEEQDSIETEILNGIGSINLSTDLVNQNIDTGYGNFQIGIEVAPKRRVYPVNFGVVKNGKPASDPRTQEQAPKSGYYIVDTYRTALSGHLDTTRLLRNVTQVFNHFSVGATVEFGLQVRRIRLRRSSAEVSSILSESKEDQKAEYRELNASAPIDTTKPVVESKVEEGLGYIFDGIAAIYRVMQTVIQTLVKPFVNDQTSQIFFAGLFDGVKMKQELFHINSETAKKLATGDILSMLQYVTYGPNVGFSSGIFQAGLGVDQPYVTREVRVTRLDHNKVRLTLIHYKGIGDKFQATMGIGLTHLKPGYTRVDWEKFSQIEVRYVLDLDKQKAADAFNAAAKQYKPDWTTLLQYCDDATSGVQKEGVNVIGDGLKSVDALVKTGREEGLKKSAGSLTAVTSLDFVVFRRKATGEKDAYKKCRTDFDQHGDAISTKCDYYTLNQKTKTRTINIPKVIKRRDALKVGCESFASLGMTEAEKTGVNLHCFYQVDDLLPTVGNYDEYLKSVKTLSGILEPQLQPLYNDPKWNPAYKKIMEVLSSSGRVVKGQHQVLHIDLYMNEEYTDEIFNGDNVEEKVKDSIAQVLVGEKPDGSMTTFAEVETRGRTNAENCHYNPKYVDVIEGADSGNYLSCNMIYARAMEMWHTFVKIKKTDDVPKRLNIISSYFGSQGRKPIVPLMFLLLGRDYQSQVDRGNLALRFSYGAADQKAEPSKTYDIGTDFDKLSQGYKPIPDLNGDPNPGTARIFDVKVCVLPHTLKAGDPKIYLKFSSSLEETIPDSRGVSVPFQLSGFVNKRESVPGKRDPREANFTIPELIPEVVVKDGSTQYQYLVEFSNLAQANLQPGVNYAAYFNLEDRNIDYGNGEYEHFSELVALLLNIKL